MMDERAKRQDHGTPEEPERDPELAALMRASGGEPPVARVDWTDLHTRIVAAVELPLARRRRDAKTWWTVAAEWSRAATWAAAAAGILFGFAILGSDRAAVRRRTVSRVGGEPSAMFVATAVAEDPGLTLLFATDRATLLQAALELE